MGIKSAITVSLELSQIEELERLVREGRFDSKSQAVRLAIDHLLNELRGNSGIVSVVKCPVCSAPMRETNRPGLFRCIYCEQNWQLVPAHQCPHGFGRYLVIYILGDDEDEETET